MPSIYTDSDWWPLLLKYNQGRVTNTTIYLCNTKRNHMYHAGMPEIQIDPNFNNYAYITCVTSLSGYIDCSHFALLTSCVIYQALG